MLVVVSVAVQYAVPAVIWVMGGLTFCSPLTGVQVVDGSPFEKVTEPVGPAPLLCVVTYTVNVTLAPGVMVVELAEMSVDVLACFTAKVRVLLVLA